MPKGWTDKTEYDRLKSQLFELTGREFERAALPLIRLNYPQAFQTSARKTLDRGGVDLVVWGDAPPYPLVVQCKGFGVDEREIGASQVQQCVDSIDAFRDSKLVADVFLLVYNRDARNPDFRAAVNSSLDELKAKAKVREAEHWPIDKLIQQSFNAMFERVKAASTTRHISARRVRLDYEPDICEPLGVVPIEVVTMVANQYRLHSSSEPEGIVGDPVEMLLGMDSRLTVVVGEAGFGKTTIALRASQATNRSVIYANAASLTTKLNGTKDLLEQAVDMDVLLGDADPEDRPTWQLLARAAVEHLFKTDDDSLLLVLDGLDESVFLLRQGGLQFLFNILRLIRTPVVLTTRIEHWDARQADFGSSIGILTGNRDKERNQQISVIKLLPWTEREMLALAVRYQQGLDEPKAARMGQLIHLLESQSYDSLYGDIPRRPLFLSWILETVAEYGVHAVGKARLLEEFAHLKIARDFTGPANSGGQRLAIVEGVEGLDATIELGFLAMEAAARAMVLMDGSEAHLLPSCSVNALVAMEPRLRNLTDPTGLVLNTLLAPARPRSAPEPLEIRFAHRAYQEYFLARYLLAHPEEARTMVPTPEVNEWMAEIAGRQ